VLRSFSFLCSLEICLNIKESQMNNLETTSPFLKAVIRDLSELSDYIVEAQKILDNARLHIFLNEHEAAQILSIKVEEVRLRRRGKRRPPHYYKIGDHVRYSLLDLLEYIESCKRSSTSQTTAAKSH